jgi:carbon storage regulator
MLVLSRKAGEIIIIGEFGEIKIVLLEINNKTAKVGVIAPKKIPVHREEVYEKIIAAAKELNIYQDNDQNRSKKK